jgi:hypothetical protein
MYINWRLNVAKFHECTVLSLTLVAKAAEDSEGAVYRMS